MVLVAKLVLARNWYCQGRKVDTGKDGGDGERSGVSAGADTKANTLGAGGALQRGHGALLERLAQLGDALGGVGAAAILIEATDLVVGQAASMGGSESVSGR